MVLPLVLGAATAAIGLSSANKASKAQANASAKQAELGDRQLEENRRQFDQTMGVQQQVYNDQLARLAPFTNTTSQQALMSEMGLGAAPEGYTAFDGGQGYQRQPVQREAVNRLADYQREDFSTSPGYQFMVDEGQRAVEGSAAARGSLFSGATLEELQRQRMGMADQEFDQFQGRQDALYLNQQGRADNMFLADRARSDANYNTAMQREDSLYLQDQGRTDALRQNHLAQLAGLAGSAQSAAVGQAQAGGQFGAAAQGASNAFMANNANATNMLANAYANQGNAAAAGAMGMGNALMGGINNGVGLWSYQNALQQQSGKP